MNAIFSFKQKKKKKSTHAPTYYTSRSRDITIFVGFLPTRVAYDKSQTPRVGFKRKEKKREEKLS